MRQKQDLDQSQYLASILISLEQLQNGETRDRKRERETDRQTDRKKQRKENEVIDEFVCGGRKHHFVVRLQGFVRSSFWYYYSEHENARRRRQNGDSSSWK